MNPRTTSVVPRKPANFKYQLEAITKPLTMSKDITYDEKLPAKSDVVEFLRPDPTYPAKETPPPYDDDGASMNTAAYCKIDSSPGLSDDETIAPPPYASQLTLVESVGEIEYDQNSAFEDSTPSSSSQGMRLPRQPLKIHDKDGYVVFHMKKAFTDSLRMAGVPEAPMTEEQERIMRNEAELRSQREESEREAELAEKDLLYESDDEEELDLGSSGDEEEEEQTGCCGDERKGKGKANQ
jgi:hypothetical protein